MATNNGIIHLVDNLCVTCSAEDLDKYLTGVQRKHEHRSQIEERRIRDDAAIEDAKRRQEEKLRQEKMKAEAEVC